MVFLSTLWPTQQLTSTVKMGMCARVSAGVLAVFMFLICGCVGITTSDPTNSPATTANDPAIESIWATHYVSATNTSQVQAVLVSADSTSVTQPITLSRFLG
ncbi:MAG TPA: hypothetical protein VNB54_03905, partial [Alphaproteobacteria bacterium]|nr:hypothetical protein [Alphaproteobacteria bacterium]